MPVSDYIPTIGLEIHVHLKTHSKMFCSCGLSYGEEANQQVCPTCLGLPGALPVINKEAVEMTILAGQMLNSKTPPVCKWDRKNYFYADMPKNYQISQYDLPLVLGGAIPLYHSCYPKEKQKSLPETPSGIIKSIPLTRIHLEEDAGKSTHVGQGSTLDFNRAGTPLMEIVTEPAISNSDEAVAILGSLRQILLAGDLSDADMEKGQMRCDVNISVRKKTESALGAKIELKNLNSISAVKRAIEFEIERQVSELDRGIAQKQQTRRWDDERGESSDMRGKEDAHDYRYFPDPDLIPIYTAGYLEKAKAALPELPHQKRARFIESYGLTAYDATVLTSDPEWSRYFETAAEGLQKPKAAANWIINELLGRLNEAQLEFKKNPIAASQLRDLIRFVEAGKINNAQAKEVLDEMFTGGKSAAEIIAARGLEQVSDTGALDQVIEDVLAKNPDIVTRIRAGDMKVINVLIGQAMKASQGKANPATLSSMLKTKLGL